MRKAPELATSASGSHMTLIEHFQALDHFIRQHEGLWRPRPFTFLELPWEKQHPAMAGWLRRRTLEEAEKEHNDPFAIPAPSPFPELADTARRLSKVAALPATVFSPASATRLCVDIPGRKWQQIQAFSGCLQFSQPPRHWLDWCAGKGHLGRLLASNGTPSTCLEWKAELVESGHLLSQRLGIQLNHLQQDVLADDIAERFQPEHTPIALHACGDLHVRLIQVAITHGCRQLALAPCCYNRIQGTSYQPLSHAGRASSLQLSQEDLRLPLSETITAGNRVRRQRDRSMAWRLGFDLLQRRLRQQDSYLPTPSLPSDWLHKPFEQYCRDLAALKNLSQPVSENWQALEQHGWQRLAQVRNLELVRTLFRRPLELWLLLDQALLLQEHGYTVRLGTFCSHALTPRNLMLLAERN